MISKSDRSSTAGETVQKLQFFRSRDFSPVKDVPFHGTLGLKSKLQDLKISSSCTTSGAVEQVK